MDKHLIRDGYNQAAERYLLARDRFANLAYLERLHALLAPHATILDLGCGAGVPVDSFLVERGHNVIGLDLSERQIALARQQVPAGEYQVADMTELRDGEYHVDAVVSWYAIFHTPRETHQRLFATLSTYLPAGGLLLVSLGSDDWEGTEPDFHGVTMQWSQYDAHTNRQIVERAGFEVLLDEIDPSGGEHHQVLLGRKKP